MPLQKHPVSYLVNSVWSRATQVHLSPSPRSVVLHSKVWKMFFFRQCTRVVPPCHWPGLTTCCSCDYGASALIAGAHAMSQLTALENAPVLFSRAFCFYQFTAGLRLELC